MKEINVVAAVIEYNGKILCMQRGPGKFEYISYKYEFPGGKVEADEQGHEALHREILEEMGMELIFEPDDLFCVIEHTYPDFHIRMAAYRCETRTKEFSMHDHIAYRWCSIEELENLDWAAADIPIVMKLKAEGVGI